MTQPEIVASIDFAEVEGDKENIVPLRTGRNPNRLKHGLEILKASSQEQEKLFQQERLQFETAIRQYQGDDPLLPWLAYIRWTQETYTSGGVRSQLLPLLELCIRTFKDDSRYTNHNEYIKIWLLYADSCSESEDVFAFLRHNNIGQQVAAFYERWALVLEDHAKYSLADKVLLAGIKAKAEPVERLQKAHEHMQQRAVARIQKKLASEDPDNPSTDSAAPVTDSRRPLSALPTHNSENHNPATNARPALAPSGLSSRSTTRPLAPQPLSSRPASSALGQKKSSQNSDSFQVFCDEPSETKSSAARETLDDYVPVHDPKQGPGWNQLASTATKNKENSGPVTTWNAPLRSSARDRASATEQSASASATVSSFEVFVDENCREDPAAEDHESQSTEASNPSVPAALRLRQIETMDANPHEALQHDPLRNFPQAQRAPIPKKKTK